MPGSQGVRMLMGASDSPSRTEAESEVRQGSQKNELLVFTKMVPGQ